MTLLALFPQLELELHMSLEQPARVQKTLTVPLAVVLRMSVVLHMSLAVQKSRPLAEEQGRRMGSAQKFQRLEPVLRLFAQECTRALAELLVVLAEWQEPV